MAQSGQVESAAASANAARAAHNRNRAAIADAIKQMVLIIISLGFANAFAILATPGDTAVKGPHLLDKMCAMAAGGCTGFAWDSLLIFTVYVLVGARFLLTNWLYLSAAYPDDNAKDMKILPDALGIFLTGLVIGVQSSYASATSPKTIADFFLLFCLVLGIDVVFSIGSIRLNRAVLKDGDLAQECLWAGNNVVFGIASFTLVLSMFPFDASSGTTWLLTLLALLNCMVSLAITYHGYFRR